MADLWSLPVRKLAAAVAFAGTLFAGASAATAQDVPPTVISPLRSEPDPNGVNLLAGKKNVDMPVVLSVPAAPRLKFDKVQNSAPYISGKGTGGGTGDTTMTRTESFSVHIGAETSESFKCTDGECQSVTYSGSKLMGRIYTRAPGGEVYGFGEKHVDMTSGNTHTMQYYAGSVAYPDGEQITYTYGNGYLSGDTFNRTWKRPIRIDSKTGYYITVSYQYTGTDVSQPGWGTPAEAALYSPSGTLIRRLVYGSSGGTITDHGDSANNTGGRTFTTTVNNTLGGNIEQNNASIQLPSEGSQQLTVTPSVVNNINLLTNVARDGVGWAYSYTKPRQYTQLIGTSQYSAIVWDAVTATGPDGYNVRYDMIPEWYSNANPYHNVVRSRTDALGRTTTYAYDFERGDRLVRITLPEGNYIAIAYDDCGNVTSKTTVAKAGSGLSNISEGAFYPTGQIGDPPMLMCPNVLSWRPSSYTDALGRVTNYTYDATTGQLTQQLDPADSAGVRRQTDITYAPSASGVSRKTLVRVCGGTSCTGSAESRTEYTYLGNTNLPLTVTQVDEATGARRTTAYTYDAAGRVLSEDGPLAGSDDAKHFRYDNFGRKTWEIGEAAANGTRLAKKFTYRDSDDKVVRVETGTVTSPTATTLTVTELTDTTYDSRRNLIRELTSAAGATYRVTDRSFLDRGLADCTTVRMNLASLPAASATGACTLGTAGTEGPDRITKNNYDNAGQLTKVQKAFGTSLQADYVSYTYTTNGKQQSVTDANGNRAQYTYDGHDRLQKWNFPDKVTVGAVSTTDYEEYGYDAAGNRTSLRKRDGSTLTYSYDGLNRLVTKVVPSRAGLTADQTRDVFYRYDVAGRQLTAKFDSATGADGITNTYNGFSELKSSTLAMGTFSKALNHAYDGAGRRTEVKHPDNQAFTYAYEAANRLTGVYEGAGTATPLDTFAYNNDGTLASRTEGASGGGGVGYTWDPLGRLKTQGDTFPSAPTSNVSWTFTISPASQIASESRDNNSYAFGGLVAVNRSYAVNGLNQYTTAGSASFTYDANGNLTADGTNTYTYDVENRLVKATTGLTNTTNLIYDPLGRLFQVDQGTNSTTTRFLYDGDALVGEFNSSNALKARFVHGSNAAADDPLVWYTSANLASKRYLHADRRGSIVAATNTFTAPSINTYDEYGIPGSGNVGRFQYTGQAWIPELGTGMYYYKARFYSAHLGRFLQVDPVGYKDDINLYAYVGNDPINANDPTGRTCERDGTNCKVDMVNGRKDYASKESYKNDTATQGKVAASTNALQRAVNTLRAAPDKQFTITVKYMETGSRIPQTASQTFSYGQLANTLINTPLNVDTENHPQLTRASGGPGFPITLYDRATTGSSYALQRTLYHEPIHYHDSELQRVPNFNRIHTDFYTPALDSICRDGPDSCK